jgi:hypothetical protein
LHDRVRGSERRIADHINPWLRSRNALNDLLVMLGAQGIKPVLTALALPPVPWLLLMLFGARLLYWRRSVAWLTLFVGAALVWLSCVTAVGEWLEKLMLHPAPALNADRIAERDYGRPLTWVEPESRDTRENASRSVAMLKPAGVTEILVVTHGWHMRRAVRAFEQESLRSDAGIRVMAAPMGLAASSETAMLRWMPSHNGFMRVRMVLREGLGLLLGA